MQFVKARIREVPFLCFPHAQHYSAMRVNTTWLLWVSVAASFACHEKHVVIGNTFKLHVGRGRKGAKKYTKKKRNHKCLGGQGAGKGTKIIYERV